MNIKRYLINNKTEFIDCLISELIKNNIPYLYIPETSEIHIEGCILFFYDKEQIRKAIKEINDDIKNLTARCYIINYEENAHKEVKLKRKLYTNNRSGDLNVK